MSTKPEQYGFTTNASIVEVVDIDAQQAIVVGLIVKVEEGLIGLRYFGNGKLRYAEYPRRAQYAIRAVTDFTGEQGLFTYLAHKDNVEEVVAHLTDRTLIHWLVRNTHGSVRKSAIEKTEDVNVLREVAGSAWVRQQNRHYDSSIAAADDRLGALLDTPTAEQWVREVSTIRSVDALGSLPDAAIRKCGNTLLLSCLCESIPDECLSEDRIPSWAGDVVRAFGIGSNRRSYSTEATSLLWEKTRHPWIRYLIASNCEDAVLLRTILRDNVSEKIRNAAEQALTRILSKKESSS